MVYQNNCFYYCAVLWHAHFTHLFTDDFSRQMLLGQAIEPVLRSVLKTGASQKKQILMKLWSQWSNTTQHIHLLDNIYRINGKSSAVVNIFQMTAQWVPKATNMLPLILLSPDALLRVAVAHLLQNTNKCLFLGRLTAGTWKPEEAAAKPFSYTRGS